MLSYMLLKVSYLAMQLKINISFNVHVTDHHYVLKNTILVQCVLCKYRTLIVLSSVFIFFSFLNCVIRLVLYYLLLFILLLANLPDST